MATYFSKTKYFKNPLSLSCQKLLLHVYVTHNPLAAITRHNIPTHTQSTDEAQMCARWHENGIKGGKCKGINRARARGAKMSQTGHFERIMTVIIRTWTELNCLLPPHLARAAPYLLLSMPA